MSLSELGKRLLESPQCFLHVAYKFLGLTHKHQDKREREGEMGLPAGNRIYVDLTYHKLVGQRTI